ncbi:MAG: MlaD family protein [Planctomycetota bacterium]
MASKKRAAEIQAGIVVLVGLAVIAFSLYYVDGGADQFRDKTLYTVYLPDAGGLKPGYDVNLDGRKVGSVAEVRAASDDERPAEILGRTYGNFSVAVAEIFTDERIPVDSGVEVTKSITGTVELLFASGKSTESATVDTIFQGRARATFEKATDEAVALVDEAKRTVAAATKVVQSVDTEVSELRVKALRSDIDTFVGKLNEFVDTLNKFVGEAEEPALATLRGASEAVEEYRGLGTEIRTSWRDDIAPRVNETLDETRALMKDTRPAVKSALQKLDDALTLASGTLVGIQDLTSELKSTASESRPHLVAALRAARLAMSDFQDAAADLKTSPWKLLNKPSDKEVESVVMLDAAKRYMDAAREVQVSVDDLKTLERLGALEDEESKQALDRATTRLNEAVDKMKAQESAVMQLLKQGG